MACEHSFCRRFLFHPRRVGPLTKKAECGLEASHSLRVENSIKSESLPAIAKPGAADDQNRLVFGGGAKSPQWNRKLQLNQRPNWEGCKFWKQSVIIKQEGLETSDINIEPLQDLLVKRDVPFLSFVLRATGVRRLRPFRPHSIGPLKSSYKLLAPIRCRSFRQQRLVHRRFSCEIFTTVARNCNANKAKSMSID